MDAVMTAQYELRREQGRRMEELRYDIGGYGGYEQGRHGGAPRQEPPAGIGVWASVDPAVYGSEWDKCAGKEATGMKYGYHDRHAESGSEWLCKVLLMLSILCC